MYEKRRINFCNNKKDVCFSVACEYLRNVLTSNFVNSEKHLLLGNFHLLFLLFVSEALFSTDYNLSYTSKLLKPLQPFTGLGVLNNVLAVAGIKLALQFIFVKGFRVYSF